MPDDHPSTQHAGCPFHAGAVSSPPVPPGEARTRGQLIAYEVAPNPGFTLEPAPPLRDWMDAAPGKFPYRCLPMVMSNQAGWVMRCPCAITATWNGKDASDSMKVAMVDPPGPPESIAVSHFGLGIITFRFPWIFRTDPGIGLWVHGPANVPKDNATALQGLVETDWSHLPFTMNWKLTKRNTPVYFAKGEPICMITPFPFDLLESIEPRIIAGASDPAFMQAVAQGKAERERTIDRQLSAENRDLKVWEKTYFKGERPEGDRHAGHRTNFKLSPFNRRDGRA